jgi:hypothetical protein
MITKFKNKALDSDKFVAEGGATTALNDSKVEEEDKDFFTYAEGFKRMCSFSSKSILGMLFHPTYMLINAKFLGSFNNTLDCPNGEDKIECV